MSKRLQTFEVVIHNNFGLIPEATHNQCRYYSLFWIFKVFSMSFCEIKVNIDFRVVIVWLHYFLNIAFTIRLPLDQLILLYQVHQINPFHPAEKIFIYLSYLICNSFHVNILMPRASYRESSWSFKSSGSRLTSFPLEW